MEFEGRLVDPRYRFRTQTLVDRLGITREEMAELRYLVDPDIAAERRQAYMREYRARKRAAAVRRTS